MLARLAGRGKIIVAVLAVASIALATALADARVVKKRTTVIISKAHDGGGADGPSINASFSQDDRNIKLMAFDSAASNIVPGDANGVRDVFLFRRGRRMGDVAGKVELISGNTSGFPANGDSYNPSVDGDTRHKRPHCVVFESTATNLAPADTSPDTDIFIRDLRKRRTELVSTNADNATNGVVDGACEFVTFEAGGQVWVRDLEKGENTRIATGTNPDQQTDGKGVAYERGGQIYYQAYQKRFRGRVRKVVKRGREVLASASRSRRRGNRPSRNPVMDDLGYYVAFESDATNLCSRACRGISRDRNRSTDIFRRTLNRRRAPTRDHMQMASFSFAVKAQGNGDSNNPAMTGGGEFIFFDSEATNLRESRHIRKPDPNGRVRDIYNWNFPRRRKFGNVSRESRPGPKGEFNGASVNPATSSRGNFIAFTSFQTGEAGERNGAAIPDLFLRFLGGK